MNKERIRLSIVSYTNTLPFRWALKNSALLNQIEYSEDIPSICAKKLLYDQADLALVPVVILRDMKEYFIVSDYCIGAQGKVDSVKLYSRVPLQEIKSIILDYQSRTSVQLTKILCKEHWQIAPNFLDALPGYESDLNEKTAIVVIGDRTFKLNGTFNYEYDLAEEWKSMTGLPFVFAAWVSNKKLDEKFLQDFNAVLKQGKENISSAIHSAENKSNLSDSDLSFYLQDRIRYNLTDEYEKAMEIFLNKMI
ncbi:MAG: menaquinone biosynthesis protein [Sphingobacteriaceae bacterium]|nr:menaquinone biosynthesis protein [Sphingobacteriaceae bacterium]